MSNDGTKLPFASPIAASFGQSTDIKIDSNNNVYVTGFSSSVLTTPNVYPADPGVYNPLFVQKWSAGPQPVLQLSSTSLTFPPIPYGGISAPQTVAAQNTGAGVLQLSLQLGTSLGNTSPPSDFVESDNCGTSLAAGASCTITVTFEPAAPLPNCVAASGCYAQSPASVLTIQTNAAVGSHTIQLSGATGHGAALSVTPNPIVFSPQAAGTTSLAKEVFADSDGDLALAITGAVIGGTNAADFQISSNGTCVNPIPLGQLGCDIFIVFSPSASATGTRTASLILTDNAGNSPQSIPISGLVTSPGASLIISASPLFLGTAVVGASNTSSFANITLTNPSTDTNVQVTSLTLGGTNIADFVTRSGTCSGTAPPFTVAKGTSCFIQVKFSPGTGPSGLRSATLSFVTNPAVTGLPTIALSGDAVTNTDASLSPTPMDFGSLQVGQASYAGNALISITAFQPNSCGGGATTCGAPLTIKATIAPAGASTTLTVTTTSTTTPGAYAVTVTGTLGTTTATATVNVTVTGITLTSGGGGSITIPSPGGSGTSTITVMPSGGFTGSVTLAAVLTSSPAVAQYLPTLSFGSTSPVLITGGTPGTATLTVSTTAPTGGALAYPARPGVHWTFAGGVTLAGVLLLGVPARRRRLRTMLGLLVFLGILAGGVIGCGGRGYSGSGGTAGTTLGNYTVTVTVTSGATSAQIPVIVTVN